METGSKSPITLALMIVSAQYQQATGEAITDADVDQLRKWAGEGGEEMSPLEAACAVIRMELMRATDRVQ
jgi:hypothetical protein